MLIVLCRFQIDGTKERITFAMHDKIHADFLFDFSPTSDGSGCAIVASEDFVKKNGLESKAVHILAQNLTTDYANTFTDKTCISMVRRKKKVLPILLIIWLAIMNFRLR